MPGQPLDHHGRHIRLGQVREGRATEVVEADRATDLRSLYRRQERPPGVLHGPALVVEEHLGSEVPAFDLVLPEGLQGRPHPRGKHHLPRPRLPTDLETTPHPVDLLPEETTAVVSLPGPIVDRPSAKQLTPTRSGSESGEDVGLEVPWRSLRHLTLDHAISATKEHPVRVRPRARIDQSLLLLGRESVLTDRSPHLLGSRSRDRDPGAGVRGDDLLLDPELKHAAKVAQLPLLGGAGDPLVTPTPDVVVDVDSPDRLHRQGWVALLHKLGEPVEDPPEAVHGRHRPLRSLSGVGLLQLGEAAHRPRGTLGDRSGRVQLLLQFLGAEYGLPLGGDLPRGGLAPGPLERRNGSIGIAVPGVALGKERPLPKLLPALVERTPLARSGSGPGWSSA